MNDIKSIIMYLTNACNVRFFWYLINNCIFYPQGTNSPHRNVDCPSISVQFSSFDIQQVSGTIFKISSSTIIIFEKVNALK